MNKKIIFMVISCMILAFSVQFISLSKEDKKNESKQVDNIVLKDIKNNNYAGYIYRDRGDTIEELFNIAEACVLATVIEEKDASDFSVIQTIEINQIIKGDNINDKINILKLKEDKLEIDREYTLMINKSAYNKEKDTYYVLGGIQGMIFEENGILVALDYDINENLKKVLQETYLENDPISTSNIITNKDKLLYYLEQLNK